MTPPRNSFTAFSPKEKVTIRWKAAQPFNPFKEPGIKAVPVFDTLNGIYSMA
jgi:hypothetical protein